MLAEQSHDWVRGPQEVDDKVQATPDVWQVSRAVCAGTDYEAGLNNGNETIKKLWLSLFVILYRK